MPDTPLVAFLRRVRSAPRAWSHEAIVEHLLCEDPLELAPLTSRALLIAGVLLPTDAARERVAERIASDVIRDVELPDDISEWLQRVALDAAHSLLLDGLDALDEASCAPFLRRLASCVGVDELRARDALAAIHGLSPSHVAALRAQFPSSWSEVSLVAVELPRSGALASEAIRHVIRGVCGTE
ncbi:MAG: hypothetical protein R3F49_08665 [Planctomycetota bacterium]